MSLAFRRPCERAFVVALLTLAVTVAAPTRVHAVGEIVRDIRVQGALRTDEATVRSIAGLNLGDPLAANTLEDARERLNTSGLFADVNVYWEPKGDGVRVVIAVRDKFPWAPLPTFSLSPGNISFGLIVVHGNLFGHGKQGVIGVRVSTADSGAIVAYRDPAVFDTWLYYQMQARFQDQIIPEYSNRSDLPAIPLRNTKLRAAGADAEFGVAWFRRIKTSVGWHFARYSVRYSEANPDFPGGFVAPLPPEPASADGTPGYATAGVQFDFRVRDQAILMGNALVANIEVANPSWGSSNNIDYWKASGYYEHGFRFFRRQNWVTRVGTYIGERLPLWAENTAGGTNLRGFLYDQFRGDTQLYARTEYHFPLFSIRDLDFRGLVFYDGAAVWYRHLPPVSNGQYEFGSALGNAGRQYLPSEVVTPGFDFTRDVHDGVGGGLRFYLRSVAVPLVGVDYGFGIESRTWRLVLVVGV